MLCNLEQNYLLNSKTTFYDKTIHFKVSLSSYLQPNLITAPNKLTHILVIMLNISISSSVPVLHNL